MEISFRKYIESYADMGFYMGSNNILDAWEELAAEKHIKKALSYGKETLKIAEKLDKFIGMKKMLLLLGPTTHVLVSSGISLSKILNEPKKISNWIELKDQFIELVKLAAINPLIAGPAAIGLAHLTGFAANQESILLVAKLASSIYFYLESILKIMQTSKLDYVKKIAESLKDKLKIVMPKTELPN